MKTPIIIAAYNEEKRIAETLRSLPASVTEPIVAVNGTTDATADIARSFGAKVYDFEEQGKLPAIQKVLGLLGHRALEPLLMLDADTRPIYPTKWYEAMMKQLYANGTDAMIASAPVWFTSERGKNASTTARSLFRVTQAALTRKSAMSTGLGGGQYGANQGLRIERQEILDRVMALGHYWPMEDVALAEAIADNENSSFVQLINRDVFAYTPESDSFPPISYYFKHGMRKAVDYTIKTYVDRGAAGSQPFTPNNPSVRKDVDSLL